MQFDIIFVIGERYFDHPLSGAAILKRLLEKNGYNVGIIDDLKTHDDVTKLGKPKLFFAISSGSLDSMLRNYNALKRPRSEDPNISHSEQYDESLPDRAVIVYCNWVRMHYKDSLMVIGGTEATLRRFTHYDYWDNDLRKPILVDSRADILAYGNSEKQILDIASRVKRAYELTSDIAKVRECLFAIDGTCIISKSIPEDFIMLPSHEDVVASKEKFCDMQNLFSNKSNLAEKIQNRFILQFKSPVYTSKDLDEYYGLPFTREIPSEMTHLRGFEFSVVTHRGCIGRCNFCSLALTQGDKIISRSEESILREIENMKNLAYFKGDIDDLGGPAANMYGMDCNLCDNSCIDCNKLKRDNSRLISLLQKARAIDGITDVFIRSGIRYDLCSLEYLKDIVEHHILGTLRIAPEHVCKDVLKLMNKDHGNLKKFIKDFDDIVKSSENSKDKQLSFYFMTAHPGSTMQHARELTEFMKKFRNSEDVQIFTPTPMTVSTCMYHTGRDPKTKKRIYIPYTFVEKKDQKRILDISYDFKTYDNL